jgi:hypothetical protein
LNFVIRAWADFEDPIAPYLKYSFAIIIPRFQKNVSKRTVPNDTSIVIIIMQNSADIVFKKRE